MRPGTLLLVAGLALMVAGPTVGQGGPSGQDQRLRLVADDAGCAEAARCFEAEDVPEPLRAGTNLTITFENAGSEEHSVYVTTVAQADTDRSRTPASAAVTEIGPIAPNETANATLEVPSADALYLWCDLDGHEADGMWIEVPVETEPEAANGPEQGADRAPLPPAALVIGLAVGAGVATSARR